MARYQKGTVCSYCNGAGYIVVYKHLEDASPGTKKCPRCAGETEIQYSHPPIEVDKSKTRDK